MIRGGGELTGFRAYVGAVLLSGWGCGVDHGSAVLDGSVVPAGFTLCQSNDDCPQVQDYCQVCVDGGKVCASSLCIEGGCQDTPAACPKTPVCACGGDCMRCGTVDDGGGCVPGTCDFVYRCKTTIPAGQKCTGPSVGDPIDCAAQIAVGVGDCNSILGWAWDGTRCIPVVGCLCLGQDCPDLLGAEYYCKYAFAYVCVGDAGP
jgi:hypothetical protein